MVNVTTCNMEWFLRKKIHKLVLQTANTWQKIKEGNRDTCIKVHWKNMEWKVIKELAPYLDKENDIFDLGGGGKLEIEVIKVYGKNILKNYYIADIVDALYVTHLMKQPYRI